MTEGEANECVLTMILFDRREWPGDQLEAWTRAIQSCPDVSAANIATNALVARVEPHNWSLPRWLEEYREAAHSERIRRGLRALPAPANCDGTGWTDGVPCPRCNPYLAEICADPWLSAQWRNGAPVVDLVPAAKEPPPPRCKLYTEEVISLDEYMRRLGLRVADGDTEAAIEHARFTRYRHIFDAGFPMPEAQ